MPISTYRYLLRREIGRMTVSSRWMGQEQVQHSGYCWRISSAVDKIPAAENVPIPQTLLDFGVREMAQTGLGFVGRSNWDLQEEKLILGIGVVIKFFKCRSLNINCITAWHLLLNIMFEKYPGLALQLAHNRIVECKRRWDCFANA